MGNHADLGAIALSASERNHVLMQSDLGHDAHLSRKGMTFDDKAGEVEGIGHFCVLRMETLVIAPTQVDAPSVKGVS